MSEGKSDGNARAPEFEVFHPREKPSPWTKVGVAFENHDGSLSVLIDYVPTAAGQLRLNVRKKKPKAAAVAAVGVADRNGDATEPLDDDVPQPPSRVSGFMGTGNKSRGGRAAR